VKALVVYAPNVTETEGLENADFWRVLTEYFENHPEDKPDILAGDCNVVEDMIDRLPVRSDPMSATDALDDLKSALRMDDGWRTTYPAQKAYTFLQSATASQSRIDRIYTTQKIIRTAREWKIETNTIPGTDHRIVSVMIAHENAPKIGKGRWSIPNHITKDKVLRKQVREEG